MGFPKRLWNPHPWRCSRLSWTSPWTPALLGFGDGLWRQTSLKQFYDLILQEKALMLHISLESSAYKGFLKNTRIKKQRHANSMKYTIIMRNVYAVQGSCSCLLSELQSVNYSMAASSLWTHQAWKECEEYQVENTWKFLLPQFVSTLTNTAWIISTKRQECTRVARKV